MSTPRRKYLSLRLSWPKPDAVAAFSAARQVELSRACELLKQRIPKCKSAKLDKLGREVAITLANGHLSTALDETRTDSVDLEGLPEDIPAFRNESWLSDVCWAASYLQDDEAAIAKLNETIDGEVKKKLTLVFLEHPQIAADVLRDLPSHLRLPTREGFNRGRPRMAQFYGASTLVTWIKMIAMNLGFDYARRSSREKQSGDESDGVATPPLPNSTTASADLFAALIPSLRAALASLFQELASEKETKPAFAQFDFAILCFVKRLKPAEISTTLGVNRPRITQLANQVLKRLVPLLIAADTRWLRLAAGLAADSKIDPDAAKAATQLRKQLFVWLQRLFEFDDFERASPSEDRDDV